jgi:hypothetical protein
MAAYIAPNETVMASQAGIRLYDGDDRTDFDSGVLQLTQYRLLWQDSGSSDARVMQLSLSAVASVDVSKGFGGMSSPKVRAIVLPASVWLMPARRLCSISTLHQRPLDRDPLQAPGPGLSSFPSGSTLPAVSTRFARL